MSDVTPVRPAWQQILDVVEPWIGPPVSEWPPDTIAWCQRCDRPIRLYRSYEPVPNDRGGSWAGFRHQVCLEVVR